MGEIVWNPEFNFITDEKEEVLTYAEYLARDDLREKMWDLDGIYHPNNEPLVFGRTVVLISNDAYKNKFKSKIDEWLSIMQDNPLQFFAPSCQGALDFLNDWESQVVILRSGNQRGKTCTGLVKDIIDLIPCHPKWQIFSEYGVKYREWAGPKTMGFGIYKLGMLQKKIWKEILKWIPDHELGAYSPNYRGKNKKVVTWERNPTLQLTCGSEIRFMVYSQDDDVFESDTMDFMHWDEQPPEAQFMGVNERVKFLPFHRATLTPHKIKGNPHTGARNIFHKIESDKMDSLGLTHTTYLLDTEQLPDWVYPEEKKQRMFQTHIQGPKDRQDYISLREGKSRFYGDWHHGGGLVWDEFEPSIHVVDPAKIKIPKNATRYRAIDHGTRGPTACLCCAVWRNGEQVERVIYREYYQKNRTINQNVKSIVEMCGNKLVEDSVFDDEFSEQSFKVYREFVRHRGERFAKDVLDSRSFGTSDSSTAKKLGWLYKVAGLDKIQKATGVHSWKMIPAVKELWAVKSDRTHIVTGEKGAPGLYVTSDCIEFLREIQLYEMDEPRQVDGEIRESPKKENDHLVGSCLFYIVGTGLHYYDEPFVPDKVDDVRDEYEPTVRVRNHRMGY